MTDIKLILMFILKGSISQTVLVFNNILNIDNEKYHSNEKASVWLGNEVSDTLTKRKFI